MIERLHFHFSLSCIGEGNGNPLQCSCLENPRDGGAWWASVYGVAHLAWRGEPPGFYRVAAGALDLRRATPVLLPGKSHGRRSLVGCSPWGREESDKTEQLHFHFSLSCIGEGNGDPTPVFLPGESQGQRSLVDCRLCGRTESDTTKVT